MNEELLLELREELNALAVQKDAKGKCIGNVNMVRLFFSNGVEKNVVIHEITEAGWVKIEPVSSIDGKTYLPCHDCNFKWRLDSISGYSVLNTLTVKD